MKYVQVYIEYSSMSLLDPFLYACEFDIQPGMRVRVPFRNRSVIGIADQVLDEKPDVSFNIQKVTEVLDSEPLFNEELSALARDLSRRSVSSLMAVYQTMTPKAWKPNSSATYRVQEEWIRKAPDEVLQTIKFTEAQKKFLDQFDWPVLAAIARKASVHLTRKLLEHKALELYKVNKHPTLVEPVGNESWPTLHPQQSLALSQIDQANGRPVLLYGVTGSGKTEVFFHKAKEALDQGKNVLFLVPEIGLTPMMISRVASRFHVPIVIYHSRLSDTEAASQYEMARTLKQGIVIGTRSAIFLPIDNIGLIILDEEHDGSYKQANNPRYHARDAALFRSRWHNCPLLLASATPSLDSCSRAWKGNYHMVMMEQRASSNFTSIQLVDLKMQQMYQGISRSLITAIEKTLKQGLQVILLLNRRGYLPVYTCLNCGHTMICEDCGLPLSWHKQEHKLKCHVCSREYPIPRECPQCHKNSWSMQGTGTERLEEAVQQLFPSARLVRMDADTTRGKMGHAKLLEEFEVYGDILIGTQMVAKGLDFERVALVGILSGDGMLARADYRAAENAYSIMEQAAGRAGRGQFPGRVMIQSWNPDHYVLQNIKAHSYFSFFKREMAYRHLGNYPPYVFLASLVFMDASSQNAYDKAANAKKFFMERGILVLGPADISMRKKLSRCRIVLKDKSEDHLIDLLWQFVREVRPVSCEINMNPFYLEE